MAAVMARRPLPVQRSRTDARGGSVCSRSTSARKRESLMGAKTPGGVRSLTASPTYPPRALRKPTDHHGRAETRGGRAPLHAAFEPPAPLTVGVEDELMLLDAETLDFAPRAREVVEASGGDPRFTLELDRQS